VKNNLNQHDPIHSNRITSFALISAVVIASLFWPYYFHELFPLSEFRDWLVLGQADETLHATLANLFERNTTYSRDFAILTVFAIDRICGESLTCTNLLAMLPLVIAAWLAFALSLRLSQSILASTLFLSLWAMSAPYLATAAWQATILDRVGLCVTMLGLLWAWRHPIKASAMMHFVFALGMLSLTVAAMNSKEAYWVFLVAAAAAIAARSAIAKGEASAIARADIASIVKPVVLLAPALIYMLWFLWRYKHAVPFAPEWEGHVGHGSMIDNLGVYANFVFRYRWIAWAVAFAVVALSMLNWKRWALRERVIVLWCAAALFGAYTLAAIVKHPAPYYLLSVGCCAALLFACVVAFSWNAGARLQYRVFTATLPILVILGVAVSLDAPAQHVLMQRRAESAAFIAQILNADTRKAAIAQALSASCCRSTITAVFI
jgi:hypothetical protein